MGRLDEARAWHRLVLGDSLAMHAALSPWRGSSNIKKRQTGEAAPDRSRVEAIHVLFDCDSSTSKLELRN